MIEINELAKRIHVGDVVALKTDIGFEYVCDATSDVAVAKISVVSQIDRQNNCALLFADYNDLEKIFHKLPEVAFDLIELSDKPLTIILDMPSQLSFPGFEEIRYPVRMVKEERIKQLLRRLKKPLLAIPITVKGNDVCINKHQIASPQFEIVEIEDNVESTGKLPSIIELGGNGEVKIINY